MKVSAAYLERIAKDWQAAYQAAHQKPAPDVVWRGGWFTIVDGGYHPKYRRAKLEQMTATLRNFTPPQS